jgi:hypothetical protein
MKDRNVRQQDAARDLDRLRREGDALGGIFTRWWTPPAPKAGDRIELWGARIGRALSVAALIGLCLYLYWTYVHS